MKQFVTEADESRDKQQTHSSKINMPVLILSGGEQSYVTKCIVNYYAFPWQGNFPDVGHASYAEVPRLYNKHIRNFANGAHKGFANGAYTSV